MSDERKEIKIVYEDGEVLRAVRGVLTDEDDDFFTLTRSDGMIRIAKRVVVKVEDWRGGNR